MQAAGEAQGFQGLHLAGGEVGGDYGLDQAPRLRVQAAGDEQRV